MRTGTKESLANGSEFPLEIWKTSNRLTGSCNENAQKWKYVGCGEVQDMNYYLLQCLLACVRPIVLRRFNLSKRHEAQHVADWCGSKNLILFHFRRADLFVEILNYNLLKFSSSYDSPFDF